MHVSVCVFKRNSINMINTIFLFNFVFYLSRTSANSDRFYARMVGGSYVNDGEYPYVALVRRGETREQWCTSSIIGKRWVITAAHCADYEHTYIVQVGVVDIEDQEWEYDVQKVIIHDKWNQSTLTGVDLALFKLAISIQFNLFVQPIALTERPTPTGTRVVMLGWGRLYWGSDLSKYLKSLEGLVLSYYDCLYYTRQVRRNELCVKVKPKDGICHGDFGGPVVANNTLVGVLTSFGAKEPPFCATKFPDTFASIYGSLTWIKRNMKIKKRRKRF